MAHCIAEKFAAPEEPCKATLWGVREPHKGVMLMKFAGAEHSTGAHELLATLYCKSKLESTWNQEEKP